MSLYLSRIALNPLFHQALKLAADPYRIHQKLLSCVPCTPREKKPNDARQPKTGDLLFRVDTTPDGPIILVQSATEPDWTALEIAQAALRLPPQTKPFDPAIHAGQILTYRLLAQPTIAIAEPTPADGKKPRGKRKVLRTDEERRAWLDRKAEAGGFKVLRSDITMHHWINRKPLPDGSTKDCPRITATRFDGELLVTDSKLFAETMRSGIGTQKAFGFGMLSIAPAT